MVRMLLESFTVVVLMFRRFKVSCHMWPRPSGKRKGNEKTPADKAHHRGTALVN